MRASQAYHVNPFTQSSYTWKLRVAVPSPQMVILALVSMADFAAVAAGAFRGRHPSAQSHKRCEAQWLSQAAFSPVTPAEHWR